jgi:signal transduction protein with GAF and PtsI domain
MTMDNPQLSFEQILNATVRMLRTTWKAKVCLFLQLDDHGDLRVRAADGLSLEKVAALAIAPAEGAIGQCFTRNKIVEVTSVSPLGALSRLIKPHLKANQKFVLAPVSGESRVLGILFMGPFSMKEKIHPREAELRSAGALCAVLSAHWRLYEWMSGFIPQLNHELRTPLTAVQGSIGMVLGGMFGQVGTDVKEMLEMAQKGCERTVRAIEDYINNQNAPKK